MTFQEGRSAACHAEGEPGSPGNPGPRTKSVSQKVSLALVRNGPSLSTSFDANMFRPLDASLVIAHHRCSLDSRICSRPKRHRSSSARESATCRTIGWTSATRGHAAGAQTEGRICQSSIISSNHVCIWVGVQDGCVGNGGYSHAAATGSQTRRFRFVALDMTSGQGYRRQPSQPP